MFIANRLWASNFRKIVDEGQFELCTIALLRVQECDATKVS